MYFFYPSSFGGNYGFYFFQNRKVNIIILLYEYTSHRYHSTNFSSLILKIKIEILTSRSIVTVYFPF
jgi:hypothetical protein